MVRVGGAAAVEVVGVELLSVYEVNRTHPSVCAAAAAFAPIPPRHVQVLTFYIHTLLMDYDTYTHTP